MPAKEITDLYKKFRLITYQEMFGRIREKDGSLSATEAYAVDVIYLLGNPTITQLADTLGISQPNATYKVNSLIRKGYLVRQNSQSDRREYHLILSDKYRQYMSLLTSYEDTVMARIRDRFPPEDLETFDRILRTMSDELMPECDAVKPKPKEKE